MVNTEVRVTLVLLAAVLSSKLEESVLTDIRSSEEGSTSKPALLFTNPMWTVPKTRRERFLWLVMRSEQVENKMERFFWFW